MVSFTFNFLMGFLPALLNSSALFPMSKGCTTSNRFKKSFQSFHSRVVSNLKVIVYESPAPKKLKNENSRFIRKSFCSLSPKSIVFSRLLFHVIELAGSILYQISPDVTAFPQCGVTPGVVAFSRGPDT